MLEPAAEELVDGEAHCGPHEALVSVTLPIAVSLAEPDVVTLAELHAVSLAELPAATSAEVRMVKYRRL